MWKLTAFFIAFSIEHLQLTSLYNAIFSGSKVIWYFWALTSLCSSSKFWDKVFISYEMLVSVWTASKLTSSSFNKDKPFFGMNQTHCFQWSHQFWLPIVHTDKSTNKELCLTLILESLLTHFSIYRHAKDTNNKYNNVKEYSLQQIHKWKSIQFYPKKKKRNGMYFLCQNQH